MTLWRSYGLPGLSHAGGALAIQCTAAWLLSLAGVPGFWWIGAALGGGFFTAREVATCWPLGRLQNRTPFDCLTAIIPVAALALAMECL